MPPPHHSPPQLWDTGPLNREELREMYDVYQNTPLHSVADTLWRHLPGLDPNRRFAVAPLPHGAANVYMRHLQTIPGPRERVPHNLIDL